MIKMRQTTWLLLICLLIGEFYGELGHASPVGEEEYPNDDYDYGEGEEDTSNGEMSQPPATIGGSVTNPPPYFDQQEITLDAKPGDDVLLNCDVRNFQISNVVMWYKNSQLIVSGQNAISNRVESVKNNSILIRDISAEDADDYYCEVLPQNVRQHTTLRVGARLQIFCDGREVTDRTQTFKQGDHHKLECRTYLPTKVEIKWSFNGQRIEGSESDAANGVIMLENIDQENVGIYQCLGDDGSREPPHGMVNIDVQYSPRVSTHRHHVNTEAKDTAELYCDYRANPIANSFWLKDGQVLSLSDKYRIKNFVHKAHNRTTLTVKNVDETDLGEYMCHVENAIGSNEVKVQLSYNPETPQFEDMSITGNQVTLHWLVRSLQPLSEAVLDYKLSGHEEDSGIWKITHQMELTPGDWHTRVKTKNTKGWSHFSVNHDFMIADEDDSNEISDSDLPPDDLVRAGFGSGGNSASEVRATLLPGLLLSAIIVSLLRL